MALSDLCPEKAQETVAFLCKVLGLFTSMQITNKRRTHASWKSVLAGVIITATTALRLHEYYIEEKGFKSLMLSRFTQDALDNLFNTIRLKSPVPRAREFKSALRLTVLDQFFKPSRHGSYDADDSVHLAKFLESRPDISLTAATLRWTCHAPWIALPSVYCSVDSSLKTVPPSVIHLHMLLQCAFCVTLISLEHLF